MASDHLHRSALLIAVAADDRGGKLNVDLAVDRVAGELERRFGFEVERCTGVAATRLGILDSLDRWVSSCRETAVDVCLVYYFGHGGRVRFDDVPAVGDDVLGYVSCVRRTNGEFEGVLGCELSEKLAGLTNPTRSVVAILDCCYAGQLVREGRTIKTVGRVSAPAWVHAFFRQSHELLAVESHAGIMRLAGSTSKRESFARTVTRGQIGLMTDALLETFDELGDDCLRASWDALTHRVRQRVIDEVGEGQWVSFAGPRTRLLFTTADAKKLAPTVGLVVDDQCSGCGWLRAGTLQGVELGDRWALLDSVVGVDRAARALAVGTVVHVELNRARVEFGSEVALGCARSNAATLMAVERRVSVHIDERLRGESWSSPWLRTCIDESCAWRLARRDEQLLVEDRSGVWPTIRLPNSMDVEHAIELLEDRAKTSRLLAALSSLPSKMRAPDLDTVPITWAWGVVEGAMLPREGATTFGEDLLWFRFELRAKRARYWFVHAIYVDIAGRSWLLNTRAPHGLEFERNDVERVGWRPGAAQHGIRLPWMAGIEQPARGLAKLVLLATSLPLGLEHLVRGADEVLADAFAVLAARPAASCGDRRSGSQPPELLSHWACEIVEFELRAGTRCG